jgi:hypothetical protein
VKLRRRVGMVEDRGDHVAGVNATKMRGGDKSSPARSADIDLERCRVAAGVLLDLNEIRSLRRIRTGFAGLSVELLDELKDAAARSIGAPDPVKRTEIAEIIGMLTGNLGKIVEHGRRADGIVRSMLQHSRGSSDDWRSTDLNALVEEASNLAYHGARGIISAKERHSRYGPRSSPVAACRGRGPLQVFASV